jgi:hypothetical protein
MLGVPRLVAPAETGNAPRLGPQLHPCRRLRRLHGTVE